MHIADYRKSVGALHVSRAMKSYLLHEVELGLVVKNKFPVLSRSLRAHEHV
jgi:hypothetical protein